MTFLIIFYILNLVCGLLLSMLVYDEQKYYNFSEIFWPIALYRYIMDEKRSLYLNKSRRIALYIIELVSLMPFTILSSICTACIFIIVVIKEAIAVQIFINKIGKQNSSKDKENKCNK